MGYIILYERYYEPNLGTELLHEEEILDRQTDIGGYVTDLLYYPFTTHCKKKFLFLHDLYYKTWMKFVLGWAPNVYYDHLKLRLSEISSVEDKKKILLATSNRPRIRWHAREIFFWWHDLDIWWEIDELRDDSRRILQIIKKKRVYTPIALIDDDDGSEEEEIDDRRCLELILEVEDLKE